MVNVKRQFLEPMKINLRNITSPILVGAGLVLFSGCATRHSQAALEAQAKISKAQAQEIALAKAPGGTVKECEIEKEHGKLVWSFDIATPGANVITEVQVDALTGEIAAIEHETPAQQGKESQDED